MRPAAAEWSVWSCRVRVVVTDPAALDVARAELTSALTAVDDACSRFRADSELARAEASGEEVEVSPLLAELVAVGLRAAERTDGDVDPTVGGSMAALGYDRDISVLLPEGPLLVAAAPGWRSVRLDAATRRLRIPPGVRVDLGATAKAWTADTAARRIAGRTGSGCLVSLGGDVAVCGPPPPGGWRVRVEDVTGDPTAPPAGTSTVVTLESGGLATSSTRARRWRRAGTELHHLLDPRTGLPARPHWRTVSVAAADCVDANTLTTAVLVRGEDAWPLLSRAGLPARLVHEDGAVVVTGGWPQDAEAA